MSKKKMGMGKIIGIVFLLGVLIQVGFNVMVPGEFDEQAKTYEKNLIALKGYRNTQVPRYEKLINGDRESGNEALKTCQTLDKIKADFEQLRTCVLVEKNLCLTLTDSSQTIDNIKDGLVLSSTCESALPSVSDFERLKSRIKNMDKNMVKELYGMWLKNISTSVESLILAMNSNKSNEVNDAFFVLNSACITMPPISRRFIKTKRKALDVCNAISGYRDTTVSVIGKKMTKKQTRKLEKSQNMVLESVESFKTALNAL